VFYDISDLFINMVKGTMNIIIIIVNIIIIIIIIIIFIFILLMAKTKNCLKSDLIDH